MKEMAPRRRRIVAACAIAAAAAAWTTYAWAIDVAPPQAQPGYLGPQRVPDEKIVVPPPPADRSISGKADLAIFRGTRSQQGSERWLLAARDNAVDPASLLDAFGCALNARLRPGDAPKLDLLFQRTMADASLLIGPPKERYNRARPFLRAKGKVCIAVTPEFSKSGSYPSGHSTVGWIYGLLLGEIAPDRASQLLARGRAFGESRTICGVHYASDVMAGETTAAALVSVLHSDSRFESDLAAARAEFEEMRSRLPAPDSERCALEKKAIAETPPL